MIRAGFEWSCIDTVFALQQLDSESNTSKVPKGLYTRKQEVSPTFDRYELAEIMNSGPYRLALYCEHTISFGKITHKRIYLTVESSENRIVQPGLLDEFELPFDVTVETYEN